MDAGCRDGPACCRDDQTQHHECNQGKDARAVIGVKDGAGLIGHGFIPVCHWTSNRSVQKAYPQGEGVQAGMKPQ